MADVENIMLPGTAAPSCSPVAVSGAALSLMPTSSTWQDLRTPAADRRSDRTRPNPVTTVNYIAGHGGFGFVVTDGPAVVPAANVAALAKQGAPPRGEPR